MLIYDLYFESIQGKTLIIIIIIIISCACNIHIGNILSAMSTMRGLGNEILWTISLYNVCQSAWGECCITLMPYYTCRHQN